MHSDETWHRVEILFAQALEQPEEARSVFVAERSAQEPEILQELLRMLDAHQRMGVFLEAPLRIIRRGP
ncbi:hypothetical protein [Paludibaculum fermentans]|uniref:Uncharacterized protein n=1 Tax=Paludibaculum fermentans TaxID=1473598 RepID=A0A7S7NM84_PALFE|nr:hypothetical protein [Paludibaculum fermentans]QOY86231.1 hypothetical protein IRI77_25935 [Paludibaculum fermentans]